MSTENGSLRAAGGKARSRRGLFLFLLLICAARCILALRPRIGTIYNDELFYLELSQNIWRYGSLTVYRLPLNFTKLLYPLLIAPFQAIGDGQARLTAISVFNAALICSALIPGWLLAKRLLREEKHRMWAMILLAVSPNMLFSGIYMAENLYYPLVLWGMYAACRVFEEKKARDRAALGILCFLLYMTKEAGIAIFAACLIGQIAQAVKEKERAAEAARGIGIFAACAALPALLIQMTVFRNMPYSYVKQVSNGVPGSWAMAGRIAGSSAVMLCFFLLSCFALPVTAALAGRKRMTGTQRRMLLVCTGCAAMVSVGIGFGITPYEDTLNLGGLLVHQRYYLGLAYLFLLLGMAAAEGAEEGNPLYGNRKAAAISLAAPAAIMLCAAAARILIWPVESPLLQYLNRPGSTDYGAKPWIILIPAAAIAAVALIFTARKKPGIRKVLLVPVICAELLSGWSFRAGLEADYRMPEGLSRAELAIVDRYLDTLEGDILVIHDDLYSKEMKTINAYLDDNYYAVDAEGLTEINAAAGNGGRIGLAETPMPNPLESFMPTKTYTIGRADYIVNFSKGVRLQEGAGQDVTPEGVTCCRIIASADPGILLLEDPYRYEPGTEILFSSENPWCRNWMVSGFSYPENGFVWTEGKEAVIRLKPEGGPMDCCVYFTAAMTNGEQRCTISAGDEELYDGPIEAGTEYRLNVTASAFDAEGGITFRFAFPDARQPGNGDRRELAAAFQRFRLAASE